MGSVHAGRLSDVAYRGAQPARAVTASSNVLINGVKALREGDKGIKWIGEGPMRHVLINGRVALGTTDRVFADDGSVATGSPNVMVGSWSRGRGVSPEPGIRLFSDYAHRRFVDLAGTLGRDGFVLWLLNIFRETTTIEAARKLHEDLLDADFRSPEIRVLSTRARWSGAYHIEDQKIEVSAALGLDAAKMNAASAHLLCVLLEEYGHHVEAALRRYAERSPGYRPSRDYGAQFGVELSSFETLTSSITHYARLEAPEGNFDLSVEHVRLSEVIRGFISEEEIADDGRDRTRAYFSAHGHESVVALAVADILPAEKDRDRVYFGNWMRDFSQFVTPTVLKWTTLSRETLTAIVNAIAHYKFGDDFDVTELLRWYEPREHIDNVWGWDPEGYPYFPPKGEEADLLASKDWETSRERYMLDSETYVLSKLREAIQQGKTPAGMMSLGAALHVIEDFYAHSNVIENTLFENFPASKKLELKSKATDGVLITGVLRTGTFGYLDTASSLLGVVAEHIREGVAETDRLRHTADGIRKAKLAAELIGLVLQRFRPNWTEKWKKITNSAVGLATRAGEKLEDLQEALEDVQKTLEKRVPGYKTIRTLGKQLASNFRRLAKYVEGVLRYCQLKVLNWTRLQLATYQAPQLNKGQFTHSQIAKDDDKSPFYDLALELALESSTTAANIVEAAWTGRVAEISLETFIQETLQKRVLKGSLKDKVLLWNQRNEKLTDELVWVRSDARGLWLAERVQQLTGPLKRLYGDSKQLVKMVDETMVDWWNSMVQLYQEGERVFGEALDEARSEHASQTK